MLTTHYRDGKTVNLSKNVVPAIDGLIRHRVLFMYSIILSHDKERIHKYNN